MNRPRSTGAPTTFKLCIGSFRSEMSPRAGVHRRVKVHGEEAVHPALHYQRLIREHEHGWVREPNTGMCFMSSTRPYIVHQRAEIQVKRKSRGRALRVGRGRQHRGRGEVADKGSSGTESVFMRQHLLVCGLIARSTRVARRKREMIEGHCLQLVEASRE